MDKFQKLKLLAANAQTVSENWSAYRALNCELDKGPVPHLGNGAFINRINANFLSMTVIGIAKLLDNFRSQKDLSETVVSLDTIRSETGLLISEDQKAKIKGLLKHRDKIGTWRNKIEAHTDSKLHPRQIADDLGISVGEIEHVVNQIIQVVNELIFSNDPGYDQHVQIPPALSPVEGLTCNHALLKAEGKSLDDIDVHTHASDGAKNYIRMLRERTELSHKARLWELYQRKKKGSFLFHPQTIRREAPRDDLESHRRRDCEDCVKTGRGIT